jgi:hypothetical protein
MSEKYKPIYINAGGYDFLGRRWMTFYREPYAGDTCETCDICLQKVCEGYGHSGEQHNIYVCKSHVRVRLDTYYVTQENDLFVLRQSRYMGRDHVDDICAFARSVEQMHEMSDKLFRGAIDYSEVEDEDEATV